jgi:hypothetical protein
LGYFLAEEVFVGVELDGSDVVDDLDVGNVSNDRLVWVGVKMDE